MYGGFHIQCVWQFVLRLIIFCWFLRYVVVHTILHQATGREFLAFGFVLMDGCWRQWGKHGIKARYLGWFSHWFVVWCNLRGFMSYSCEIKASHSRSPKSPVQYTYSRHPWLLHTQPFSHTSWCWTVSYDESSQCGNAGSEIQIAGSIPHHTFRQQWCFLPGMSKNANRSFRLEMWNERTDQVGITSRIWKIFLATGF